MLSKKKIVNKNKDCYIGSKMKDMKSQMRIKRKNCTLKMPALPYSSIPTPTQINQSTPLIVHPKKKKIPRAVVVSLKMLYLGKKSRQIKIYFPSRNYQKLIFMNPIHLQQQIHMETRNPFWQKQALTQTDLVLKHRNLDSWSWILIEAHCLKEDKSAWTVLFEKRKNTQTLHIFIIIPFHIFYYKKLPIIHIIKIIKIIQKRNYRIIKLFN